jgi:protein gp37
MLGLVELDLAHGIEWVVIGGESGPGARPMAIGWVESLATQAQAFGIPLFFKQLGTVAAKQARVRGAGEDFEAIHEAQAGRLPAGNWSRREFPRIPELP